MNSVLTQQPGTGVAPPLRPSFWRVAWATFVGYFVTLLICVPVGALLQAAGVDVFGGEGRGLFHRYDVWSWLAEACAGVLVTIATAWFVRDQLRARTGWEVPFGFTFATLLVTGYAPALAFTPFYWAAAPVSLAAAALVLRRRAEPSGAEPLTTLGGVPRRYRRRVVIALAVGVPVMFAYVLAYGATHPIRTGTQIGYSSAASDGGGPVYPYEPGHLRRYTLPLRNSGPYAITNLAVVRVEGSPALQLERVGLGWPPKLRPLAGSQLRSDDTLTLELRQGRLCAARIARLDAVWIRYSVLGMRHEQRIELEQPPGVRCP
jgi:hypothetical protein